MIAFKIKINFSIKINLFQKKKYQKVHIKSKFKYCSWMRKNAFKTNKISHKLME